MSIDGYRAAVFTWRRVVWCMDGGPGEFDQTAPRWHEMHAAGWMPAGCGKLRRVLHCPALTVVIDDITEPGALLAKHFELMGEPIPEVCPALHVLDTWASRSIAIARGKKSPRPRAPQGELRSEEAARPRGEL